MGLCVNRHSNVKDRVVLNFKHYLVMGGHPHMYYLYINYIAINSVEVPQQTDDMSINNSRFRFCTGRL